MSVLSALTAGFPNPVRDGVGIVYGPVLDRLRTYQTYNTNAQDPNLIPNPGDLLDLVSRGIATTNNLKNEFAFHAINIDGGAWPLVVEGMNVCPPPDQAVHAYWRDRVSRVTADRWVKYNRIRKKSETDYLWSRPYQWNAQTCRVLHSLNHLTDADYTKWLKASGLLLQEDRFMFEKLIQVPQHFEVMEAYRRGIISKPVCEEYLKNLGFTHQEIRDVFFKLAQLLPSPSDLVRFGVREVWDQNVVNQFGYDDEFNNIPAFNYWMDKLGYSGSPDNPSLPASGMATWAQAFWRAHWTNLAPFQAFKLLHRLRPTGGPNGGPRIPFVPGTNIPVQPWTMNDVRTALKINDYPPAFRDRLASISYNVLRLVDIRRIVVKAYLDNAFKLAVIGPGVTIKDWAKEQHLDRGNTPENANTLALLNDADGNAAFNAQAFKFRNRVWKRREKRIGAQYAIGGITPAFAQQQLIAIGWPPGDANDWLAEIDQERAIKCAMQNMAVVKTRLLAGKISPIQAFQWLVGVGILPARAQFWVACWNGLLLASNVQPAAQAALVEHKQGLLTRPQAMQVLNNLGYRNAEALLEMNEIERLVNA